jgi:ribokinase
MKRNSVLVIGSANIDMVVAVERFPKSGETIFANKMQIFPGGKGANQAVCCSKLGGKVYFLGKIGNDIFGERLRKSMEADSVYLQYLLTDGDESTGLAFITVDDSGQNQIIVISGSNKNLSPSDIEESKKLFELTNLTLLQLEVPLETVIRATELARQHGHIVILNPAPARNLPEQLLKLVDYLTPNETEAEILTGISVIDKDSATRAGRKLIGEGVSTVIVTLGDKGSILVTSMKTEIFPAMNVTAVDTTAAGDAFNGALAYSIAAAGKVEDAIRFATNVAAFSVTRIGAQTSMPTQKELKEFLNREIPI